MKKLLLVLLAVVLGSVFLLGEHTTSEGVTKHDSKTIEVGHFDFIEKLENMPVLTSCSSSDTNILTVTKTTETPNGGSGHQIMGVNRGLATVTCDDPQNNTHEFPINVS